MWSAGAVRRVCLIGLSIFALVSPLRAAFIEWKSPSAVGEEVLIPFDPNIGAGTHNHNSAGLPSGLMLGAVTEVVASKGMKGDENAYHLADMITRNFMIRRSSAGDPATIRTYMTGSLTGRLTFSESEFAQVEFLAEVLGTGLKADGFKSSGGNPDVPVDIPFDKSATLAVDQEYTLKLVLQTNGAAIWNGKDAASAKSNFLDTLTANISIPEPTTLFLCFAGMAVLTSGRLLRR